MSGGASEMRILATFGSVVAFGSERANLEVLTALKDRGAKVLLLVSDAPYAQGMRDHVTERGFEIWPCPFITLPRSYNGVRARDLPWQVIRASVAFLEAHKAFAPTHIQSGNQLFVLNFLPALALVRTPMVYRCGDAPAAHNPLWRFVWRFISRRARRFGAVSKYIIDRMVEAGTPRERITLVYSRPTTRMADDVPVRKAEGQVIGFVGQVNPGKGPDLLVAAFEQVAAAYPEARLKFAGRIHDTWEGDAWGRDLRDRALANPALAGRVEFCGFVEDIPGFLAGCAFLVAPTVTEEPMGNVVMEAKQAARASVIFRSGGFPEVIEHGRTGYVCGDKTAEALAEALRFYLANPDEAGRQGEAAFESLEALGVGRFAETWETIYEEAAR